MESQRRVERTNFQSHSVVLDPLDARSDIYHHTCTRHVERMSKLSDITDVSTA